MNRRMFLCGIMTSTAGVGVTRAAGSFAGALPRENRAITFLVKGFSCVTCATGLEVTLLKHQGVSLAKASYPEGELVVRFDDRQISEQEIKDVICGCGLAAEKQSSIDL